MKPPANPPTYLSIFTPSILSLLSPALSCSALLNSAFHLPLPALNAMWCGVASSQGAPGTPHRACPSCGEPSSTAHRCLGMLPATPGDSGWTGAAFGKGSGFSVGRSCVTIHTHMHAHTHTVTQSHTHRHTHTHTHKSTHTQKSTLMHSKYQQQEQLILFATS